ncbi:MAG: 4-hydroxy-3-methylbut-2-enyl diphosphate reductase [Bacillota bacterium]
MKVKEAKYSGFCYGVKKAVDVSLKEYHNKTYTYGQIIHNAQFEKKLENKGIESVESIDNIDNCNLIIRAHGVSKKIYEKIKNKNINLIDATCPYVKEIHKIVENDNNLDKKIIIIGDPNHPEIIGINGWCENKGIIIENINYNLSNVDKSDIISVVCQTTYNEVKYKKIKNKLKNQFENIRFYDTICSATKKRQDSALKLAKKVDVMLVVGGKNSSNTKKLFEICKKVTQTYWIQTYNDIVLSNLTDASFVGIVGGASTPDWIINNIKKN